MRRTRKLFLIGIGCAGVIIVLLLAAVVSTRLLANQPQIKSYIADKTTQATGGDLAYDRITIAFLPLPHLTIQTLRLDLPETFSLSARELAVYPRILAMLRGRLAIHRLRLNAPDIRVHIQKGAKPPPPTEPADDAGAGSITAAIADHIGSVFGALAAIDPGTQVEIDQGRLSVAFPGQPDLHIHAIQAMADTTAHGLSVDLSCSSDLIDKLTVQATADVTHSQAEASIALAGINPQPLFSRLSLPEGISIRGTQATADVEISISGPEDAKGRFHVRVPDLAINRGDRLLNLSAVSLSGTVGYEKNRLSLHLDKFACQQPALDLSATAVWVQDPQSNGANLQLSAGASQLDVAVIADLVRSMAGDLESIRTAFDVARAGILAEPVYSAAFEYDQTQWRVKTMKATGRLSQGVVSLSAINAEAENVAGEIVYEDDHVDFQNLSGRFEGAAFEELDLSLDWAKQTTWALQSSSVDVDAAPFFNWLTGFEALAKAKETVSITGGHMALSTLKISGPLTKPGQWDIDVIASPRNLVLNSPHTPFDIKLSGGEIAYDPDKVESSQIKVEFLDAAFVASHQLSGLVDPQEISLQIDGTLGPDATTWLNKQAPIPDHLQINPPVSVNGVHLTWNHPGTVSLTGELETAGDVALLVDFTYSPEEIKIRKLQFADNASKATISASKGQDAAIELTFSGNVNKHTADRLLETNQILSGNIQGDFKARIDTDTPLNSTFVGKLSGNGLHLAEHTRVPLTVSHFSIIGRGNQFDILPSQVTLEDMVMGVSGTFHPRDRALIFDINVDSDRLDVGLIQSLISDENASPAADEEKPPPAMVPSGTIHLKTGSLTYGGFTWSPLSADIRVESGSTYVTVHQAQLCGISTPGDVDLTPQGIGLNIRPLATNVSLQETSNCLWEKYVQVDARYDLVGNIVLLPTQGDPITSLSGRATVESQNGRIYHSSTLLKIFSVLNITELFTGGRSDLKKRGYGYSEAWVKARIEEGKLHLDEVLLDGNALKITGQGSIDLKAATADIIVLAAPLKTVDRLVNKLSIFRYITGGSLVTVPLRVHGDLKDLSVVPLPPSAVGKGLLHFMERTLKSPFKLIEGTREAVSDRGIKNNQTPAPTPPREP